MTRSLPLRVTEIFHSLQGESSFTGRPCVFVRLTGCPLRCTWCDTDYAFFGGHDLSIGEIVAAVREYGCPLVEVTGGEPLAQPHALPLLEALADDGFTVLLETSGAVDASGVDPRVHLILDVKCPGSGMTGRMHWPNVERLRPQDEAKFVIQDRQDYEWAKGIVTQYELADRCTLLFSPVFGALDPRQLAEWVLADRLPVRFQLQLHKYVWAPDMRGV
jgi:7-carboxy-7-deazaguanine synthase